jgi:hypothetical protein
LDSLSKNDRGSAELLNFGYHVLLKKDKMMYLELVEIIPGAPNRHLGTPFLPNAA